MHTVLTTAKEPGISMQRNGLDAFSAIDATYPTLDPSGPLQARLATLSSAKEEMTLFLFDDIPAYLRELRKLYVDCATAVTAVVRMRVAGATYVKTMPCAAAASLPPTDTMYDERDHELECARQRRELRQRRV